jgi:hypothetical protein
MTRWMAILTCALAACTMATEISEQPLQRGAVEAPDPTAHAVFVDEVQPTLISTCRACHVADGGTSVGPAFLDEAAELSYTYAKNYQSAAGKILTASPESSLLVTKGAHIGPALTDAQKAVIARWLQLEQQENPQSDPLPPD